jgi:hypothetical protein
MWTPCGLQWSLYGVMESTWSLWGRVKYTSLPCPISHLSFIAHNLFKLQDPSRRRAFEKFHPDTHKFFQPMLSRCEHESDICLILFVEQRRWIGIPRGRRHISLCLLMEKCRTCSLGEHRFRFWSYPHGLLNLCHWIKDIDVYVLYTPPPFPTDSDGLSPDPANSNGPSGQSVRLPTDSVGLDQIPLLVWSKSGESPVKSPWSRKSLDWPD